MIRRQTRAEIDEQDRRERSMLSEMLSPRGLMVQAIGVGALAAVAVLIRVLA